MIGIAMILVGTNLAILGLVVSLNRIAVAIEKITAKP